MPPLFELDQISQSFDGVTVLDNACLTLAPGEIHVLTGSNGTGKTVLQRMISGRLVPDSGRMLLDGKPLPAGMPSEILEQGITTIHEHVYLLPQRTVTENIYLGREPVKTLLGIPRIDWRGARAAAAELLQRFGLPFSPDIPVERLTTGQQRMVEMIRALSFDARLIVVDEPTLYLGKSERELLLRFIRTARDGGTAFLLLTNSIGEIHRIADRLSLLYGNVIHTYPGDPQDHLDDMLKQLSAVQAGRYPKLPAKHGAVTLSVNGLCSPQFEPMSFQLREGEILGLAGFPGSGARAVGKALFGLSPTPEGEIRLQGRPYQPSPTKSRRRMGYVSGVNPADSLVLQQNVAFNLTLANLPSILHRSFLRPDAERELSRQLTGRLRIRNAGAVQMRYLSGGNQRKVNLGRWIAASVKVLILDEPTMGMDVDSRLDIYNIVSELALRGIAILFISSDFQELAGMCDRVLVMREGSLVRAVESCSGMEQVIWHWACEG